MIGSRNSSCIQSQSCTQTSIEASWNLGTVVSIRQNWLQICCHKLVALNTMAKCLRPYMNVACTKTIKLLLRCQRSIERKPYCHYGSSHDRFTPMQGKQVHHCTLHKMLLQHSYSPNLNLASHPPSDFSGSVPYIDVNTLDLKLLISPTGCQTFLLSLNSP